MKSIVGTLVVIAAGSGGGGKSPDGGMMMMDDGGVAPGTPRRYVMSAQQLPTTNNEARDLGLDLDADGTPDNALGMMVATMAAQGFDVQADADRAVDRGEILMLAELRAVSLLGAEMASFTLFSGDNAQPSPCTSSTDTICARHLTGSGIFDVALDSARDTPLLGAIRGGELVVGPGQLRLETTFMSSTPITFDLIGARVHVTALADGSLGGGRIGGAVTQSELDAKIFPQMQQAGMAAIQQDCTMLSDPLSCGCASSSTGESWINLFDSAPADCAVSVTEIKNNALVQSLFAPDVMIEGQQGTSIGVGFSAVRATFTP